jgi:hypothetical protein
MSAHEYTPQDALEILMHRLRDRNSELADHIQAVVDAGKDVQETETYRGRRKQSRSYRKTQPYSYEEALQVALDALQCYFVEQYLFIDSCLDDVAAAMVALPRTGQHAWLNPKERRMFGDTESRGKEKEVNVELRTETQISQPGQETFRFQRIATSSIEEERKNFARLRSLLEFKE